MATNRNRISREIEAKFQTITLPDGKDMTAEELANAYEHILIDLNITTLTQLEILRSIVQHEVMRVQAEIQKKAVQDFAAGRITMDQLPLKRVEMPNGYVSFENVPPEMMTVASFMGWLNEKAEET